MSLLSLEALHYRHAGAAEPALRDVTLDVQAGELVLVAGASGSGKSTLLRACSGLVPHFHGGELGGRATVCGLDTREHGPAELAAVCGSLFQEPETQVVMGTVRAELALGLEQRGASATAVAREVEEVALALGVAGLLERPTHELSGGELQRVALAAALAGRPPLICLDEPTSQLDPVAADELIWLVRRLNEQWGVTVLLAEHRLERCLPAADRVVVLEAGAIACDAPPREFLEWAGAARPELRTVAAELFERAGLRPPPEGVKQARATLRAHGLLGGAPAAGQTSAASPSAAPRRRAGLGLGRRQSPPPALELRGVWHELSGGRAVLRGVDLRLEPGERVALMGRNGAGKSTLLRHAKGLTKPTRGRVRAAGEVALLLQTPGDYLLAERVGDEAPAAVIARAGLAALADRHPRDLSGGERQRLALALVTEPAGPGATPPAVVCLDEPTRGMDRGHRDELIALLDGLASNGSAVLVATHDPELAAGFADRVVLLGDGRPIADGPPSEMLSGGWHFATETARVLGGAGGALHPAAGAELLRARLPADPLPSTAGAPR